MEPRKQDTRTSRAWGQTAAAVPEIRKLMEQAREDLDVGLDEEVVRQRVLERAKKDTLAGIRVLLPSLNRRVLRAPAPVALQAIAREFSKRWKKKRVQDGVNQFLDAVGWDAWLVDFVIDWAKTGEPGPIFAKFHGGVHPAIVGKKDDEVRMVMLVATPTSDLEALIEELRAAHQQIMPRASLRSVREPEIRARWFRLFREGMTDREIARMELEAEGFSFRATDDAEYKRELELMRCRIKTARARWQRQVTEILDPL